MSRKMAGIAVTSAILLVIVIVGGWMDGMEATWSKEMASREPDRLLRKPWVPEDGKDHSPRFRETRSETTKPSELELRIRWRFGHFMWRSWWERIPFGNQWPHLRCLRN
jgi:hypothetical protein